MSLPTLAAAIGNLSLIASAPVPSVSSPRVDPRRLRRTVTEVFDRQTRSNNQRDLLPSAPHYWTNLTINQTFIENSLRQFGIIITEIRTHLYKIQMPRILDIKTAELDMFFTRMRMSGSSGGRFIFESNVIHHFGQEVLEAICKQICPYMVSIKCSLVAENDKRFGAQFDSYKKLLLSSRGLKCIDFSDNVLLGSHLITQLILCRPEITELSLQNCNRLKDDDIDMICTYCDHLQSLDVSGCPLLSDKAGSLIARKRSILNLSLEGVSITDITVYLLAQNNLQKLNIDSCQLVTEASISEISPTILRELIVPEQFAQYKKTPPDSNENIHSMLIADKKIAFDLFAEYLQQFFPKSTVTVDKEWIVVDTGLEAQLVEDELNISEFEHLIKRFNVRLAVGCSIHASQVILALCPYLTHLTIHPHVLLSNSVIECPKLQTLNLTDCRHAVNWLSVLICKDLKHLTVKGTDCDLHTVLQRMPSLSTLNVKDRIVHANELLSLPDELNLRCNIDISQCSDYEKLLARLLKSKKPPARIINTVVEFIEIKEDNCMRLFSLASTHNLESLKIKCDTYIFHNFSSLIKLTTHNNQIVFAFISLQNLFLLLSSNDEESTLRTQKFETFIKCSVTDIAFALSITNDLEVRISHLADNLLPWIMNTLRYHHLIEAIELQQLANPSSLVLEKLLTYNSLLSSIKTLRVSGIFESHIHLIGQFAEKCDRLTTLTMTNCHVTGSDLKQMLDSCKKLETLVINNSPTFSDFSLGVFRESEKRYGLKSLDLTGCSRITNLLPLHWILPCLEELTLAKTSVTDDSFLPSNFGFFALTSLNLSDTYITDKAVHNLSETARPLKTLMLNNTRITPLGVRHLAHDAFALINVLSVERCPSLNTDENPDQFVEEIARSCPWLQKLFVSESGNLSQKAVAHLLNTIPTIQSIEAYRCRNIPARLNEALTSDVNQNKTLQIYFSDYTTQDTITILIRRHPYARSIFLEEFADCRKEYVDQICSYYSERELFWAKNCTLRTLVINHFGDNIKEYLRLFAEKFPHISTLSLKGTFSPDTVTQIASFSALKKLQLCSLGNSSSIENFLTPLHTLGLEEVYLCDIMACSYDDFAQFLNQCKRLKFIAFRLCKNMGLEQASALSKTYPDITIQVTYPSGYGINTRTHTFEAAS